MQGSFGTSFLQPLRLQEQILIPIIRTVASQPRGQMQKETWVADSKAFPDAYDGREQALIKHTLLENYLQKLFLIVGMSAKRGRPAELCYIDCFAGPWGDESESMDSTSISISLRVLDSCRQTLESLGVNANIRALYVEEDGRAFGRLSN